MLAKSSAVIHVSQCSVSAFCATERFCICPKVNSSMILSFPVFSKMLGVIHGCVNKSQCKVKGMNALQCDSDL